MPVRFTPAVAEAPPPPTSVRFTPSATTSPRLGPFQATRQAFQTSLDTGIPFEATYPLLQDLYRPATQVAQAVESRVTPRLRAVFESAVEPSARVLAPFVTAPGVSPEFRERGTRFLLRHAGEAAADTLGLAAGTAASLPVDPLFIAGVAPGALRTAATRLATTATERVSAFPRTVNISQEEVHNFYTGAQKVPEAVAEVLKTMSLEGKDLRQAVTRGIRITIPATVTVTRAERPIVSAVKRAVGLEPSPTQTTVVTGRPTTGPFVAGELTASPEALRAGQAATRQRGAAYLPTPGEAAQPFYSSVERVLDEKMPSRAMSGAVLAMLKNTPGIKQEELDWLDLPGFLQGKGTVSKPEVLDYVRANQVQVQEVTLQKDPEVIRSQEQFREALQTAPKGDLSEALAGELSVMRRDRYITPSEYDRAIRDLVNYEEGHLTPDALFSILGDQPYNMKSKFETIVNQRFPLSKRPPKFAAYQLPGGTNYRELLLTLPEKKPIIDTGERKHFALKTIKQDEYTGQRDVDVYYKGEKVGGRYGTRADDQEIIDNWIQGNATDKAKSETFRSPHFDEPNVLAHVRFNDRVDAEGKKVLFLEEVQRDAKNTGWDKEHPGVLPFSKTYYELVLKRMLRYAAEHGYDKLAWTTGAQQNERYDLSKQIGELTWHKSKTPGGYSDEVRVVAITPDKGTVVIDQTVKTSELENVVGKEVAQRIIEDKGKTLDTKYSSSGTLEGLDLQVGGEGMKAFYDQIIPQYLNKYTKKWGGRVGETNIVTKPQWRAGKKIVSEKTQVHALAITPSMKASVLEGQALFEGPGRYAGSPFRPPPGVLAREGGLPPAAAGQPTPTRVVRDLRPDEARIMVQATARNFPGQFHTKIIPQPDGRQTVEIFTETPGGATLAAEGGLPHDLFTPEGIRPERAVPVRSRGMVSRQFADTHPGVSFQDATPTASGEVSLPYLAARQRPFQPTTTLTNVPGIPVTQLRVIPISREEADQLLATNARVRTPGSLSEPAVVRIVPPRHAKAATGLQYWYRWDLPTSTPVSYTTPTAPRATPALPARRDVSGASFVGENLPRYEPTPEERVSLEHALQQVRRPKDDVQRFTEFLDSARMGQITRIVAKELLENAEAMQAGGRQLFAAIKAQGGIRRSDYLSDDQWREIPAHLKNQNGLPLDGMANALSAEEPSDPTLPREVSDFQFEGWDELFQAIRAVGVLKKLTLTDFLPQAKAVVSSEAARILRETITAPTPDVPRVKSMVRRLVSQIKVWQRSEIAKAAAVLNAAQLTNLTPTQLARYAKNFLGKKTRERITAQEVGQLVQGMTRRVFNTETGEWESVSRFVEPRITGQPPTIPTTRALVPVGPPGGFSKDLPFSTLSATSEVDPLRAAELIDGKRNGWTSQTFIHPVLQLEEEIERASQALVAPVRQAMGTTITRGSEASARIQRIAEGTLAPDEAASLTEAERQIESLGRQIYAQLLVQNNEALSSLGKPTITPITQYAHHFQDLGFMESVFGGLQHVPKSVAEGNYRVGGPGVILPGFVYRRKGGPYTEDYIAGLERYIRASMRLQKNAPVIKQLMPMLRHLPPIAQRYFTQWLGELSGRKATLDYGMQTPPAMRQAVEWFTRQTNTGLILGNLSTALIQFSSTAQGIAQNGLLWQLRGQLRALTPEGFAFALTHSSELKARRQLGTLLYQPSEWMRKANLLLETFDQFQVSSAWLGAFERAVKEGQSFEASVALAESASIKTNATMRMILKSPVLRQRVLIPIATQLQTFNVNWRQTFTVDPVIAARERGTFAGLWQLGAAIFGVLVFNEIYKKVLRRGANDWTDLLPIFFPGTLVPLGPIAQAVESRGRFVPAILRLPKIGFEAVTKATQGKDVTAVLPELFQALFMFIPGGNQLLKSGRGLMAALEGGQYTKDGRLKFPVSGFSEQARAVLLGPYGTEAAQAYIERGFKPVPQPRPFSIPRGPSLPSPFRASRPVRGVPTRQGVRFTPRPGPSRVRFTPEAR